MRKAVTEDKVRLYNAAPDLLAAAEAALDMLENMTTDEYRLGDDKPQRERLRAAIARARGEE